MKIWKRPSGTRLKFKLIHAMTYPIQLFSLLWKRLDYFRLPKHSTAVVCEYLKCNKRARTLLTWWASQKHTSSYFDVTCSFSKHKIARERGTKTQPKRFSKQAHDEKTRGKKPNKTFEQFLFFWFWSGLVAVFSFFR